MRIDAITLYRIALPLVTPYRLSYRTFERFAPILVAARAADGRVGWGEAHISPGSGAETRGGGWAFARGWAERLVGRDTAAAKAELAPAIAASPVAATGLMTAIEMLERHPLLRITEDVVLPLLTAFNAEDPAAIAEEVAQRLAQGFRTFKIKVGKDVEADLARLAAIQKAVAGRASLRIDANRAYSRADGCRFAAAIDPAGVALFEQPCAAEDWEANAAVAAVSRVPLMLDEPICSLADIARAATIPGVGLCKVKLKRFGGLDRLHDALRAIREHGLQPVLGDGLGCEISGWMEACVARDTIDNAGEFNGYLKPRDRLFAEPLGFEDGALRIPAGWWPEVDRAALDRLCLVREHFAPARVAASA